MDSEKNSEKPIIYQSWTLTKVKYNFTKVEKHIFLKVIDIAQKYIKKEMLGKRCSVEMITEGSHTYPEITFPIKDLLSSNSCNYQHICDSIESLGGKPFGLPTSGKWDFDQVFMFQRVRASKENGLAKIEMTDAFWKAFLNMQTYKMLDRNLVYEFKSVFTSRMYDFLVEGERSLTYKIKNLQGLFCLEDTYTPSQFIKRVIDVAQKEMKEMEKCPFYFEYDVTKSGRSLDNINFKVIYKTELFIDLDLDTPPGDKEIELDKSIALLIEGLFGKEVKETSVTEKLIKAQSQIGTYSLKKEINKIWTKISEIEDTGKKCNQLRYLSNSLDNIISQSLMNGYKTKVESKKEEIKNDDEISYQKVVDSSYIENQARLAGISFDECAAALGVIQEENGIYKILK